ncbi:MAG: oligosaccharide flippase family protein [Candidatus Zixiibacteriota bacterium]|nr:MAG: oligosaccharide flippase family protein [candidate division Zixibacteria bacterium]
MDLDNYNDQGFFSQWRDKALNSLDKYRGMGIRVLLHNFFSLSILQAANYLLPLIILPYLVRVIGVEKLGLIVFAQAVISYFNILTDYGFHLSATRDIAAARADMDKVSVIFSSVMVIKSVLLVAGFGILLILVYLFDKFSADATVYLLTYGTVLGNYLYPIWFFQGIERMKYITVLSILGRVIYIILLLIFVHQENDYIIVPLLNSIGMVAAGILSMVIAIVKFKVKLQFPAIADMWDNFRRSSQFFLSRVAASADSSFNTVILGLFTSNEMVGYFAAAEKLFVAMRNAFMPLVQALYPYMANRSNVPLFRKVFYVSVAAAVVLSVLMLLLSDVVIGLIFGAGFELSSKILRLFSLGVPFMMASILLGYPFLAALGHESYANYSVAIGSVTHLVLISALIPIISPFVVAAAMVFTQLLVLVIRIGGIRKHHLWQLA